jgi:hypothetical protein
MLPEGATDMTRSGLALILIPIAGTISVAAWLTLVFHAGSDPRRAGETRHPATVVPARPHWLTGADQTPARRIRPIRPAHPGTCAPGPFPPPEASARCRIPPGAGRRFRPDTTWRRNIVHPMFVTLFINTDARERT